MEDKMDVVVINGAITRRDVAETLQMLEGYSPIIPATKEQIINYLRVQNENGKIK